MNQEQLLRELASLLWMRAEQQLLVFIREQSAIATGEQVCDVETGRRIVWLLGLPD